MSAPPFERIGIVGLGLIGGSIALATKRRWPSVTLTVCDPAPVTSEAVTQGLVTTVVAAPGELKDCDLILIATPVQTVPAVLAQLTAAGTTALVTDTGSTKRMVMKAARTTTLTFVGGHPVAGAETSGLGAARADLFDGRPWLLVSSSPAEAHDPAVFPGVLEAMLATFVVGLGARPEWTDAVTHDRVMAHVSHAPQVVSTALMAASGAAVGKDGVAWSGKGFADMTRLASSSPDVWQGILDSNADFIADALGALSAKLPTSAEALTNTPVVRALFERARELKADQ
jgi:prephenate dehydrogenase